MRLWHGLRREAAGAWRSLRYDLDLHRAAKLASAFTEEFAYTDDLDADPQHGRPGPSRRSRLLPLWGVGMLFVGGAAGAYLAIGGGLAALGTDRYPFEADRPGMSTWSPHTQPQPGAPNRNQPMTTGNRPPGPHRPAGARPAPVRTGPAVDLPSIGTARPEATPLPSNTPAPSPSATPSMSVVPAPSTSPSADRSESRAPGAGR
jgi:hypothetical protein